MADLTGLDFDTLAAHDILSSDSGVAGAFNTLKDKVASINGAGVVGIVSAPVGAAAANTTKLAADAAAAVLAGVPLIIKGAFSINARIDLPAGVVVRGEGATITQTSNLTGGFRINTARVRVTGVKFVGVASDYVNTDATYGASAILVDTAASDVRITDCTMTGWAGAGVMIAAGATNTHIRDCTMIGVGSTYITSTSLGRSAGVRSLTSGRWTVTGCDISQSAQGIVTSDGLADVQITNNHIHDIPGQHGFYLESMLRGVIANNLIHNTGLLGMKVQIGTVGAADPSDISILGNVITNAGDQGILLTNPVGSTPRLRRVSVIGNVITSVGASGININNTIGAIVADNIITTCYVGITLQDSSKLMVMNNRIEDCQYQGIWLSGVDDVTVRFNRIIDPGKANGASTEHGLHTVGACTELVVEGNKITDSLGNMAYGAYFAQTSGADTLSVIGNYTIGATAYGLRFTSTPAVRAMYDNNATGTTGKVLSHPVSAERGRLNQSFGSAAPTTGTYTVGHIHWNSVPAASGTIGWVCTTAGTPGTWKTFGAISA